LKNIVSRFPTILE